MPDYSHLGFDLLGTLPSEPGGDPNESHFLVRDRTSKPGSARVVYNQTKGVAYCNDCQSSTCLHALVIADHFRVSRDPS